MIPVWLVSLCLSPFVLAQSINSASDASSNTTSPSTTLSATASEASNVTTTQTSASTGDPVSISISLPVTITTEFPSSSSSPSEVSRVHVPIQPYTFTPFPKPSQSSIPGVFVDTDPSAPPQVGASFIPNFGPAWESAWEKAKAKVSSFTLEQKIKVTTGHGWMKGRCVGNIEPVGDWPGLCLQDSPVGVRLTDHVTVFPAGINVAATWNRDLIRARGLAMGEEFVGKGVNVALGPMMNMGRVAQGGRNWEGFGADPFLTGEAAYETILGLQHAGVQACAKHFIFNEQEHNRTLSTSDVDDRTAHELYGHPFLKSVQAGVASMMCSYNAINGTYACEHDSTLNQMLKKEYGFQGYVMSDWFATMSTISAITGLDMDMPGDTGPAADGSGLGDSYFGANLTSYVNNGTVPEARIDDMATRIIAGWYFLHQDSPSYPTVNFDTFQPTNEETNQHIDVQADHYELVRKIGAASTVLLKNKNNALPLTGKERSIFLAGSDAGPPSVGPNRFADQGGLVDGVLAMGWGSGSANFTYLVSPYEAIAPRARKNHTSLSWSFDDFNTTLAAQMATGNDAALVFIASDSGEGYITYDGNEGDRKNLTAWHNGDDLVLAVAAKNPNTIVIVNSVGPLIVEPWIEHENVTAVVWAGLQGTEAGNAIVDVLYGDYNPSGKLPYTIAKQPEDYSAHLVLGGDGKNLLYIPYTEGLEIDYRHFDAHDIEPRFEFGFGLSYTTWNYSDLSITAIDSTDGADASLVQSWAQGHVNTAEVGSSVAVWLHRPAFNVTFNIQNTGDVYGVEIPQLYLNFDQSTGEPPSILRGFTDVALNSGETKSVSIPLSRYDLSTWDVVEQGWRKANGTIGVTVGKSSRDSQLHGSIPL